MVNDATVKYREPMACGLLAAAALGVLSALSLLFKNGDDLGGGIGFAEKSAAFGALFESSLVVLALVGAVLLVTRLGEPSRNARVVVLAAMGIGAVALLFAVITFVAQLGADSGTAGTYFGGVIGAGKAVGVILGLAHLLFLGVALLYLYTAFQALPAPVPAAAPWAGGGASQQGWGRQGKGQQGWGQQGGSQQGWSQQGWAQPGPPAPQWAPPQPGPPVSSGWAGPAGGGYPQPGAGPSVPSPSEGWPAPPGYPSAAEAPPPQAERSGDDTPERPEDPPPSSQGWWQHPGQ